MSAVLSFNIYILKNVHNQKVRGHKKAPTGRVALGQGDSRWGEGLRGSRMPHPQPTAPWSAVPLQRSARSPTLHCVSFPPPLPELQQGSLLWPSAGQDRPQDGGRRLFHQNITLWCTSTLSETLARGSPAQGGGSRVRGPSLGRCPRKVCSCQSFTQTPEGN